MIVPYVDLAGQQQSIRAQILDAVGRVLDHGQFILGPEVAELEARLQERLGAAHVVAVNSGTDALAIALRVRGIGPGDEVITPSHSFVATASAIALLGATPVFAEVDEETMLLDPAALRRLVNGRTRAVLPVHLNGFACDLDPIRSFCADHGLALIEDCAQAFGTRYKNAHVGTTDIGCFSLHPLKPFAACGDGGFITFSSTEDAAEARLLRNIGLVDRDHCAAISGNSRLDAMQAAILLVKLRYVDAWIEERRANASAYRDALEGALRLPPPEGDSFATYSAFVVRHERRDALVQRLRDSGVDAKIHYPLAIHQQEAFERWARPLPITERVVSQIVSLPVSAQLAPEQREHVVRSVRRAVETLTP
ncbi:MAG TPA: DegT/DnrJ/EryC1/StrS family aminotransferase [Thermoanaerobaculia bacterium]|nr:DegT/DnrJ/EryC1/StrS family aminotransferase [Thermoanaerobaculia bacterium]